MLDLVPGILELFESPLEHFVFDTEIFCDSGLIVQVEAGGFETFDLDVFILIDDIFSSNIPDDVEIINVELSLSFINETRIKGFG